ncbi:hypothetical protein HY995_03475 [Candidatus Micrarchaeota archaeon]|nr:hypothetical protein [Candidatus Micrarchaeota archaeon]MBI5177120.1 hypothetical protein [Candidatus Micrarchaeota archaeon]
MLVLVLHPPKAGVTQRLALEILSGAAGTGAQAELVTTDKKPNLSAYDLAFIGSGVYALHADPSIRSIVEKADWSGGRKAAFFCTYSHAGKKAVGNLSKTVEKKGGVVLGTLSIRTKGILTYLGRGELTESDLVRAHAFGEKMTNTASGRWVKRVNEKERIRGYKQ